MFDSCEYVLQRNIFLTASVIITYRKEQGIKISTIFKAMRGDRALSEINDTFVSTVQVMVTVKQYAIRSTSKFINRTMERWNRLSASLLETSIYNSFIKEKDAKY